MTRQTTALVAVLALAVVALWWVFLMSPPREEIARLEAETDAAEQQAIALEGQISRLQQVRTESADIEAAIATLQEIVPNDDALPSALRQIQAAADDAGLDLVTLATSRPSIVDEATGLHSMALSLTADGSYFQVVDFLRRVEDPFITSRGVQVDNVAISPTEHPELTLTLTGQMFAVLDTLVLPDGTAPAATTEGDDAAATEGEESSGNAESTDSTETGDEPLTSEEGV